MCACFWAAEPLFPFLLALRFARTGLIPSCSVRLPLVGLTPESEAKLRTTLEEAKLLPAGGTAAAAVTA
jgi:hypothetical protein